MALPTTGAISLNAVAVEAGYTSATVSSLNDTTIRRILDDYSTTISLNQAYGKSRYFVTNDLVALSNKEIGYPSFIRNDGYYKTGNKIYTFIEAYPVGDTSYSIGDVHYYNNYAGEAGMKRFSPTSITTHTIQSFVGTVDQSDNYYVSLSYVRQADSKFAQVKYKLNSAGTVQWTKLYPYDIVWSIVGGFAATTSYVYDYLFEATGKHILICYNSAGTLQWSKQLVSDPLIEPTLEHPISTGSDSSVYISGISWDSPSYNYQIAVYGRLTTAGAISWLRKLYTSFGVISAQTASVTTESSVDYVYVLTGDGGNVVVAKYNSSGTIQWKRVINGGPTIYTGKVVASADATAGSFCVAITFVSSGFSNVIGIFRYNLAGILQWTRYISNSSGMSNLTAQSLTVSADGVINLHAIGDNGTLHYIKLPADGSRTGTYSTYWTYSTTSSIVSTEAAATAFTDAATTATATSVAVTINTSAPEITISAPAFSTITKAYI